MRAHSAKVGNAGEMKVKRGLIVSRIITNFNEDLEKSQKSEFEEIFMRALKHSFGSAEIEDVSDIDEQKTGRDKVYGTIPCELKGRHEVYNDIALEIWSDKDGGKKGWIRKDSSSLFILYAWFPINKVIILDWKSLKSAWDKYGAEWERTYKTRSAYTRIRNGEEYESVIVPVPTNLVLAETYHEIYQELYVIK